MVRKEKSGRMVRREGCQEEPQRVGSGQDESAFGWGSIPTSMSSVLFMAASPGGEF